MWIFWVVAIFIIIALVWSYIGKRKDTEGSGPSALDILKRRYARGEISKEEFEEKKKDLT